jgi:hypothetical protein
VLKLCAAAAGCCHCCQQQYWLLPVRRPRHATTPGQDSAASSLAGGFPSIDAMIITTCVEAGLWVNCLALLANVGRPAGRRCLCLCFCAVPTKVASRHPPHPSAYFSRERHASLGRTNASKVDKRRRAGVLN